MSETDPLMLAVTAGVHLGVTGAITGAFVTLAVALVCKLMQWAPININLDVTVNQGED